MSSNFPDCPFQLVFCRPFYLHLTTVVQLLGACVTICHLRRDKKLLRKRTRTSRIFPSRFRESMSADTAESRNHSGTEVPPDGRRAGFLLSQRRFSKITIRRGTNDRPRENRLKLSWTCAIWPHSGAPGRLASDALDALERVSIKYVLYQTFWDFFTLPPPPCTTWLLICTSV